MDVKHKAAYEFSYIEVLRAETILRSNFSCFILGHFSFAHFVIAGVFFSERLFPFFSSFSIFSRP